LLLVLQPNAQLSAAPLAGVEGELAVGWRPQRQWASRRQRVVERTDSTTEAAALCRKSRAQVPTAPAVSAAQRG
jgi:hypothetical protein